MIQQCRGGEIRHGIAFFFMCLFLIFFLLVLFLFILQQTVIMIVYKHTF